MKMGNTLFLSVVLPKPTDLSWILRKENIINFITTCSYPLTCVTNKSTNLKHMLSLVAGCLALRTRNGRLKNSFNPGGTLPIHPVGPKKWTCIDMRGLLKWPNTSFTSVFIVTYCTLNFGLPYT